MAFHRLARGCLVLVLGIFPVLSPEPGRVFAQASPGISVSPSNAAPGENVTLSGAGWPAGAMVVVRLAEAGVADGPRADVAVATTHADGSFSVQGTVPRTLFNPAGARGNLNVVPGSYTLVASNGPGVTATIAFTVGAPRQGSLLWGVAFFDTNGNGRMDDGDVAAVADVTMQRLGGGGTIQVFSDGRGRYVAAVPPGSYQLSARSQFQSASWSTSTTATAPDRQTNRVNLALRPAAPAPMPPPSHLPGTGGVPVPLPVLALVGVVALALGAWWRRCLAPRC